MLNKEAINAWKADKWILYAATSHQVEPQTRVQLLVNLTGIYLVKKVSSYGLISSQEETVYTGDDIDKACEEFENAQYLQPEN